MAISNILISIILSMLPVSELRGGIPYALATGISVTWAFVICILANIAVVPLIFLFLDTLHVKLLKFKAYKKTFNVPLMRIRKEKSKIKKKLKKYGILALIPLVALPLPFTGAWTGTLVAWFFGLNKKKSIAAIAAGVVIAGILVMLVALGIINIFIER